MILYNITIELEMGETYYWSRLSAPIIKEMMDDEIIYEEVSEEVSEMDDDLIGEE